jgi:tetratricopeptide (TPR) repeat protein
LRRIIFATGLLLSIWSVQLQAQTAGKIVSLQGRAELKKTDPEPWLPAANLQLLYDGNTIRTLVQSRAVVLLADETQLKLNASTTLRLRSIRQTSNILVRVAQSSMAPGAQSLLDLSNGQVWLRSKLKPANVKISTPAVTAAIRGTEFDLRVADDGESVLTMLDGLVDFRNDQGAVLVGPGEQARARIGQAPTKSVLLRPRDAVQWVLYYPGTVSPADYPFLNQNPAQLQNTVAAATSRRATAPGDVDNLLLLARAQHDLGKGTEAEATLKAALSAEPRNSEVLTDLAWLYLESGNPRAASDLLGRVSPPTDRSTVATAMAYYAQGEAQMFFDTIRRVDPERSSLAATQRAFSELLYGDAVHAKEILAKIPSSDPNYSIAQGLMSNVLLAQDDKNAALEAAQRAVGSGPRSPSAYLNLSLVQQSFFQIPEALRSARLALEIDPEYPAAQAQVAKLLFGMGDTAQAEQIVRAGLNRNASDPAMNSLLGFILLAQAKTDESKVYFQKSIGQDSTRGEPYLGLGIASMRQGRRDEAIQSILVASTLDPQLSIYQSYLGKAFYDERRFEMAFDALDAASTLDPKDPTPHLYSGIFYNDLSRPAEAVRAFTKSIELNDNRAVYRSRFLLDGDRATRNVNLATAYNRLYLSEWGNYEALRSQIADPTNSSVHIFLAQTFLNLRGRTQAAGSEQLLARMLLPVNANSFNSFNDYTTLFEEPRSYWTTQGQVGSFNSRGYSLIATGGTTRFAYGAIGTYFRSDGFRAYNDNTLSYQGIAQMKFALSPHSDFLFLYSHGELNQGDHGTTLINFVNNTNLRQFTRNNRAEFGYHRQFRPGSDLLVYFSGQQPESVTDDPYYFPNLFGAGLVGGLRSQQRNPDLDLQATHLLKVGEFQFRYGFDIFEGRARDRRTIPCCQPQFDGDLGETIELRKIRYKNAYLHTDYQIHPRLILTGALHYDWSNDNNLNKDPAQPFQPISRWDPQAGFFFMPFNSTGLRFSFIRSLQTHNFERLAPTNVEGFVIAQNDPALSRNTGYSFGWDQRMYESAFFRGSAFYRDRETPVLVLGDQGYVPSTTTNHFHGADLVWDQMLGDHFSLVPQYSVIHADDLNSTRHEHDGTLRLFFISPRRIWLSVGENYVHQAGVLGGTIVRANFFTTDLSASYELPRKLGLITFGVTNLFDHKFALLVDPLALDPRVPRRQFTGTVRFNM